MATNAATIRALGRVVNKLVKDGVSKKHAQALVAEQAGRYCARLLGKGMFRDGDC